jgi:hypothetical protein
MWLTAADYLSPYASPYDPSYALYLQCQREEITANFDLE